MEWSLQEKHFALRKTFYWKCPQLFPVVYFIISHIQIHFHPLNVHSYSSHVANHFSWENKITHSWMSHFQEYSPNSYFLHLCFYQQFTSQHSDFCQSILLGQAMEEVEGALKKSNFVLNWILLTHTVYQIQPHETLYFVPCFMYFSKLEFSFSTYSWPLTPVDTTHSSVISSKYPSKALIDQCGIHWFPFFPLSHCEVCPVKTCT